MAELLTALRFDNSIRVIILSGTGDEFFVLPGPGAFDDPGVWADATLPSAAWRTFNGIIRTHELMAAIERPIIAAVNGAATAFGVSLVFASDLIVATHDAIIADLHLSMGEFPYGGPRFGLTTGDGGSTLVPLYMSLPKGKEFLMLAKPYTGRELAQAGIINASLSADELHGIVEGMAQALLRSSPYALAWTKRVTNRHVVDALNRTIDAGIPYETTNFLQLYRNNADPQGLRK
jgi:enoyl-CoA hydratase